MKERDQLTSKRKSHTSSISSRTRVTLSMYGCRAEDNVVVCPGWARASLPMIRRVSKGNPAKIPKKLLIIRRLADTSRRAAELAVAEHGAVIVTPRQISQLHRTRLVLHPRRIC